MSMVHDCPQLGLLLSLQEGADRHLHWIYLGCHSHTVTKGQLWAMFTSMGVGGPQDEPQQTPISTSTL